MIGFAAANRAVTEAGSAVSVAAAPVRVRLSDPTLIGRSVQTAIVFDTRTATTKGAPTTQTGFAIPTGTTYDAGARGNCASAGHGGGLGDGGDLPSGCQTGSAVTVPSFAVAGVNTNTAMPQLVLTTTTTKLGSLVSDTYGATGTPVVQIGTMHALTRMGALHDVSRPMNRALDEAMGSQRPDGGDRTWIGFVGA